ncbi:MAG: 5'/3'-nucleotidase SurE [Acidobacteriota bacterium]
MADLRKPRRRSGLGMIVVIALLFIQSVPFAQTPFRILLSNDDGIQAPGILALFARLSALGEVTVAAPATNQSGVGHALTFSGPIAVESWERGRSRWFAISASPATCVRMALTSLSLPRPDIVVSGINKGENTGVVTFSSGTVACAREAAFRGIPALAVSLEAGAEMDYEAAADFVVALLIDFEKSGLPAGTYLNVNYPALPRAQIKGVLVTRQDRRPPDERYEIKITPEGKAEYLSVYKPLAGGDKDCDTWALTQGYISITPMSIDQTRITQIESLRAWEVIKSWK